MGIELSCGAFSLKRIPDNAMKELKSGIAGAIIGGGLIFLCIKLIPPELINQLKPHSAAEKIVFVAGSFVALFVTLCIHELGHLVMGIVQGFRFELFVVGFLGVRRNGENIQFYFNKQASTMGGVTATSPRSQDPDNRLKFARMVLAGPLTSLVYALLCVFILAFSDTIFSPFFAVSAVASFGFFLVTTIPTKSGVFFTDRAKYQRLMNTGKTGDIEQALLETIAQNFIDNSCKNISVDRVRIVQTDPDAVVRFWGYFFEFQYYIDHGDPENAARVREELINLRSHIPAALWKSLSIDAVSL
jgi:Zn-dependent protease